MHGLKTASFSGLTFWHCMFLHNLFSIRSISHYISTWKEMFGKQYSRSDPSLGIFGFSSKCSPSVSLRLQPAFCVPHGRDCWGPVGEWKVSTMDKGMCGTSHPFLLFLAAIIVWKCCRQLLHCTVHSQTIGNLPAFCTWKWCLQNKRKDPYQQGMKDTLRSWNSLLSLNLVHNTV